MNPQERETFEELSDPDMFTHWWAERIESLEAWARRPDRSINDPEPMAAGLFMADVDIANLEWDWLLHEYPWPMTLASEIPTLALADADPLLRMTAIHHLFSWCKSGWIERPGQVILEWGGGYGDMARQSRLFHPQPTHLIVDSPVMAGIQAEYLASCDVEAVPWFPGDNPLPPGSVGLVPNMGVDEAAELHGPVDLFLALWSLDESSRAAQAEVLEHAFYGARSMFLAVEPNKPWFPSSGWLYEQITAHLPAALIDQLEVEEAPVEGSLYVGWRRPTGPPT